MRSVGVVCLIAAGSIAAAAPVAVAGSAASADSAATVATTNNQTEDPPIPVVIVQPEDGVSSRGTAGARVRVAMVDSGVNYTLPAIAAALARDAEGTALGHDYWDLDARPFDSHPIRGGRIQRHGTQTASVLIDEAPDARLVPYRYPRPDMSRMAQLVEHAAAIDVRVIGLPLGGNDRTAWAAFEIAAREHPDLLFVASAGNDGRDIDARPIWPAALPLENLIVVSSADDFGALADGVNWGREHVDYLIPAEHVSVLQFDGSRRFAAGSSYAVPKLVALAARMLALHPDWKAAELIADLRRRFGDGSHPRFVREGMIADPQSVGEAPAVRVAERLLTIDDDKTLDAQAIDVPVDALRLNAAWPAARVDDTLRRAARILAPCQIRLSPLRVIDVAAPARLTDLSPGGSRTLFDAVRSSGADRRATLVFARDTQMAEAYDGEAFGAGNTRHRPWLADSVWLTAMIDDAGIALAHELVHVLANSGAHDARRDNLMAARTSGDNVDLDVEQCTAMRDRALAGGLARRVHDDQ